MSMNKFSLLDVSYGSRWKFQRFVVLPPLWQIRFFHGP